MSVDATPGRALEVGDTNLLMDLLAGSCSPLDFLREFTQNGCEGIAARGPDATGTVLWDIDWRTLERTGGRVRRLVVVDDGIGMDVAQLLKMGRLFDSTKEQGVDANFGVGARISGGKFSPAGVEWRSWHRGHGHMVVLHMTSESAWELRPLRPGRKGQERLYTPLSDADRPGLLRADGLRDGTEVTFVGEADGANTYDAPPDADAPTVWIRRSLNGRYFTLPAAVQVRVREQVHVTVAADGEPPHWEAGDATPVRGAKALLDASSIASGAVAIADAVCHWWLLKSGKPGGRASEREWAAAGFAGMLYKGEIYDCPRGTAGGYNRLQSLFRIRVGYDRVVLLVEPPAGTVTSDPSRSDLKVNGARIPWTDWGASFAQCVPEAIADLQDDLLGLGNADRELQAMRQQWFEMSKGLGPLRPIDSHARTRTTSPTIGVNESGAVTVDGVTYEDDGEPERGPAPARRQVSRPPALHEPEAIVWLPSAKAAAELLDGNAAQWGGFDNDVLTIHPQFSTYVQIREGLLVSFSDPADERHVLAAVKVFWQRMLLGTITRTLNVTKDRERQMEILKPTALTAVMLSAPEQIGGLRRTLAIKLGSTRRGSEQASDHARAGDDNGSAAPTLAAELAGVRGVSSGPG